MKYLYISTLSSERLINEILEKSHTNPGFAVQKFGRLVVKGFVDNGAEIEALSAPPIVPNMRRLDIRVPRFEVEDGITYNYVPFLNIKVLRQICIALYAFFYVIYWGIKEKDEKCIICDILNISICSASLRAARLLNIKRVGIVTDLPGLKNRGKMNRSLKETITQKINDSFLANFTHYVLLTEQMNGIVNPKSRPYIVMEGLSDATAMSSLSDVPKDHPKVLLYAGGIDEQYGLKTLVEAFSKTDVPDWELHLFGNGPFVSHLSEYSSLDKRIKYMGIVANEEVVKAEKSASLLINPRPTTEAFTKYSFPSKNIEYMTTGTPLVTTKLPGMPIEYYPFVYLLEDETVDGWKKCLELLFHTACDELERKGKAAREFILDYKNNQYQTGRIIELINNG